MALIELNEVEYYYSEQKKPALKNINLNIEEGSFTAVIGSNGSGKSTFARLLNALLIPSKGKILIDGLAVSEPKNRWDIRQRVGMVFQNPDNQLVAAVVEDDVAFGLENLGVNSTRIRKSVDKALTMVGMNGFQKHITHDLSGGQKQRVAIAGIIAMEPSCIVFDEPTTMLDPRGRREVLDTITYLNKKKNITVVYITHHMEEVIGADNVVVIHEGEILNIASPRKVFADSDTLHQINLDVPAAVELAEILREKGLSVPEILGSDELVDFLC